MVPRSLQILQSGRYGKILCNEKDKLLVYFTGHDGRGEKKKPTIRYVSVAGQKSTGF